MRHLCNKMCLVLFNDTYDLWMHVVRSSFFQSLCVLGYCVLPLTVAMLICRLVLLAGQGPINFMIRLFVVVVMFAWSVIGEYILISIVPELIKPGVKNEELIMNN